MPDLKPGYNLIRTVLRAVIASSRRSNPFCASQDWIASRTLLAMTAIDKEQTHVRKNLLAGKRILVTGGGSGLGAAMGRRFVELGAELIICGRRA